MTKSDTPLNNHADSSDCTCSWSPVVGWIVCSACCNNQAGCTHIVDKLAELPTFTCPVCSMTSYHPKDIEYGYCGNCHEFTGEPSRLPGDDQPKP